MPLSRTAERLIDALGPMVNPDDESDHLRTYLEALARQLDFVADLSADDDDGTPGYSVLFDPDRVPAVLLPFVGQFVGVSMPEALDESQRRLRLRETDGFRRGTPAAIRGAARQYLTGTKTVYLIERQGSAYQLTVATNASETPDPDVVERAVSAQIPAGIVVTITTVSGGTFASLRDTHATFAAVSAVPSFTTFGAVRADPTAT